MPIQNAQHHLIRSLRPWPPGLELQLPLAAPGHTDTVGSVLTSTTFCPRHACLPTCLPAYLPCSLAQGPTHTLDPCTCSIFLPTSCHTHCNNTIQSTGGTLTTCPSVTPPGHKSSCATSQAAQAQLPESRPRPGRGVTQNSPFLDRHQQPLLEAFLP